MKQQPAAATTADNPLFYPLQLHADSRGILLAVENNSLPFSIMRVYFLSDMPADAKRGGHAHYQLEQVAACLRGSCTVLLDDGKHKTEYALASSNQGLYIGKMLWRELYNFSPDCVVAVFASAPYDEGDYIRDYAQFRRLCQ